LIRDALNRFRQLYSGKPPEIAFVRVEVPEERLREMLRTGGKDLILRTTAAGEVTAECKACKQALDIAQDGELLWLRCPMCRRVSFNAIANVHRDVHFATQDGKPLEYEIFYVNDLPPSFRPPFRER
jgi:hypothetical protein